MGMDRKDLHARYALFEKFALQDQRNYYKKSIRENRRAASQVNRLRAGLALLTGIASALAGFIVQSRFLGKASCTANINIPADCPTWQSIVVVLTVMAVVLPAVAALFSTLADLYQWDKLITIYSSALENLEVADAQSPHVEIPDEVRYRASLRAFVEGTLQVMSDETAQWGQSIRTPEQVENFIREEQIKAERRTGGTINSLRG